MATTLVGVHRVLVSPILCRQHSGSRPGPKVAVASVAVRATQGAAADKQRPVPHGYRIALARVHRKSVVHAVERLTRQTLGIGDAE